MDCIPRDVFRCLVKFFTFRESRILLRLSKRWNLLYESEDAQWQVWCQEQFGDIHPDIDMVDYSTFPDRWRLLFKMFWNFRSRATKMFNKRDRSILSGNQILQCWYHRSKSKSTIYASNLFNRSSARHGDILFGSNFRTEHRDAVCFVDKKQSTGLFVVLGLGSTFAFPQFPLDYFLIAGVNDRLNIRMTAEDFAALTFHPTAYGSIHYYEDPRAPGIRFVTKVQQGYIRPTPENLITSYMANTRDMISVTCEDFIDNRCIINML